MAIKRILEGLTFVVIGGLLLANTSGVLPWGIWLSVLSLWPLLLVAAGIDLIGKSVDNEWLRALSSLVVIAGLLFGALVMPARGWTGLFPAAGNRTYSETFPSALGVGRGEARISGGGGEISIQDGQEMLVATVSTPFGRPEISAEVDGPNVDVEVGTTRGGAPVFFGIGETRTEVALGRDIDWNVDIDAGAADIDADLSELEVSRVSLDIGAAAVKVRLSDLATETEVRVNSGAASVEILVPEGVEVEVRGEGFPNSIDVPSDWDSDGGMRRSPGFADAARRVMITMNAGATSLKVQTY